MISGSIILPLLILIVNTYCYDFIDFTIGIQAGKHHGYTFFVLALYPLILLGYWPIMWQIDKYLKQKITS